MGPRQPLSYTAPQLGGGPAGEGEQEDLAW